MLQMFGGTYKILFLLSAILFHHIYTDLIIHVPSDKFV